MNYFQPYAFTADKSIVTAWDFEIARAAQTPWLAEALAGAGSELFPRFADCYAQLRALPRGARRALQGQLARSQELAAIVPEWLHGEAGHALQQKLARTLAGAALLLALGQGVAQANQINVTAKTPPVIAADGKCSLIEAIINAEDTSTGLVHTDCDAGDPAGADSIVLPAKSKHTLTYVREVYYNSATGLPLITGNITIEGNSATITRSKKAFDFRLMAVASGGSLTLNDVKMSGGVADKGGAIFNYGSVTINGGIISKNLASSGGAIYTGNLGTLHINSTTITGNKASYGGGIFSRGSLADVIINNSTISKNSAYDGGGLANLYGNMRVNDCIVTGNKAVRFGGGASNGKGTFNIDSTTISKNSATFGGGVFNIAGDFRLYNSTVTGNKAKLGGGVLIVNSPYGTFVNSGNTFSKNKAPYGPDIAYY